MTVAAPVQTTLEVYCAWCGRYLHDKPGEGTSGKSHGICHRCAVEMFQERDRMEREESEVRYG